MYDLAFVILNYNTISTTLECVKSIKTNIDTDNYCVVVVDNFSKTEVASELEEAFKFEEKVICIKNKENMGFARGNNLGISYVRQFLEAKFICCLNNDTVFVQKDFYSRLIKCYNRAKVAVIGPKIELVGSRKYEVLAGNLKNVEYYKEHLCNLQRENVYYGVLRTLLLKYAFFRWLNNKRHLFTMRKSLSEINLENDVNMVHKDIVLQGCCLIFTPSFFEKLNGFDSRTFMYREEELLYVKIKKCGLETLYYPDLLIKHLCEQSTRMSFKGVMAKYRFKKENEIESLKVLIEEMENM